MGKVGFTLENEGFTTKFEGLAMGKEGLAMGKEGFTMGKEGFTTKRDILPWEKKVMGDYSTITSSVNNQPPTRPLAMA